jgi:hypothetical protein
MTTTLWSTVAMVGGRSHWGGSIRHGQPTYRPRSESHRKSATGTFRSKGKQCLRRPLSQRLRVNSTGNGIRVRDYVPKTET